MIKNALSNLPALLIGMLFAGILSLVLGKELCWDLAYYHFYNAYAFFNARNDFWSNLYIHQYINPAIDFLPYFLIITTKPIWTVFLLGAIHGINFFLVYKIALLLITTTHQKTVAFFFGMVSSIGANVFPGIGSFQNDAMVSIFVLGFLLLTLDAIKNHNHFNRKIFFAALLLGAGVGLKLTAAIFVPAALISILIIEIQWQKKIFLLIITGIGLTAGLAITSGYWMYTLWQQHGNPFFPFFNNVFHSPDFPTLHFRDERFLPKNIVQHLFFPFLFSWDGRTADINFTDFRFAIVYTLLLMLCIKKRFIPSLSKSNSLTRYFFCFFIISYIAWQLYFSIARYLIVLEMLAPIMIYLLILNLTDRFYKRVILVTSSLFLLIFFIVPVYAPRTYHFNETFFNVKIPVQIQTIKNAVVLISHPMPIVDPEPRPQTYLIPYFPKSFQFIGVPFVADRYIADSSVAKIIGEYQKYKNLYVLTTGQHLPHFDAVLSQFHLRRTGECYVIRSDRLSFTGQKAYFCALKALKY